MLKDQKAYHTFLSLINGQVSLDFLLNSRWPNQESQVRFLEFAVQSVTVDRLELPFDKVRRKLSQIDNIQGYKPKSKNFIILWSCIDLVECLVELSESQFFGSVRNLIDQAAKQVPDYLLLSAAATKPRCGTHLLNEIYS